MASLSCGYKCLQTILVIFNILVLACGIALVVIGGLAQYSIDHYSADIGSNSRALVIFVLVLGCFLFLLGVLGFCGACTKNTCCLILYAILLSVMVAAEIAAGIAAAVLKDEVKTQFLSLAKNAVKEYSKNPKTKEFLDKIQQEFQCCGSESANDYISSAQSIPASCTNPSTSLPYSEGCANKLVAFFEKYIIAVIVAAFVFAIIQMMCIVSTICVIQAIKSGDSD
ncbi:unnamed protein product [Schistosoma turkestanicum]|nr:unnamed protein product [Schistosoma turkestanicum]